VEGPLSNVPRTEGGEKKEGRIITSERGSVGSLRGEKTNIKSTRNRWAHRALNGTKFWCAMNPGLLGGERPNRYVQGEKCMNEKKTVVLLGDLWYGKSRIPSKG